MAPPEADILVAVSHDGDTYMTAEAVTRFPGRRWLVTGNPEGRLAELCEQVVVVTPERERSMCHTASYTCAVAGLCALRGEDVSWLADAVAEALARPGSGHEPRTVAGGGSRARLADGAGGRAEASRGLLRRGRGAPHRAAPARPSRGGGRERALLRPRGGRARGRARTSCRCGARGARLRRHPRTDQASRRRHRPVSAADARPRRLTRREPRPHPSRRRPLGSAPALLTSSAEVPSRGA